MSSKHLLALVVLGVSLTVVPAQTMSVDSDKVLSQFGESESVQLSLPIQPGVGVISRQQIKRGSASMLRLHFVVATPASTPSWGVQILDKNDKKVWSYSAASDSRSDFWTGL